MAGSEDRPVVVSGGDQMITITLPPFTKPGGGTHKLSAVQANGPFQRIVFTNNDTKKDEFTRPAKGNWTITIE